MGIIFRQSFKSTIVTYLGILIGYFSVLWVQPFCLSPEEIGLFRALMDITLICVYFAQLGIPLLTVKYFPHFNDKAERHHGFFMFILAASALGFFLFSIVFFLIKDWIASYFIEHSALLVEYIYYVIPLALGVIYMNVLEAYSKVNLRIVVPNLIRQIVLRALFILVVLLYYFNVFTFPEVVMAFVIINVAPVALYFIYFYYEGWLYLNWNWQALKSFLSPMSNYALFAVVGGTSTILFNKVDVMMISGMQGLTDTGIYTIALLAATVIEIPKRTLGQIVSPIVANAIRHERWQEIDTLYQKTSINQLLVSGLLFILLWVNVDALLSLIPNSEVFAQGKYVILFIALGKLFDIATGINDHIILNSEYYRFNVYVVLVMLPVSIALNYFLIPEMGIIGAALATAVTIFLYNLVKMTFIWLRFQMQPFTAKTIVLIVLGSGCLFLGMLMPGFEHPVADIGLRTVILSLIYLPLTYFFKISDNLNAVVRDNVLNRLRRR